MPALRSERSPDLRVQIFGLDFQRGVYCFLVYTAASVEWLVSIRLHLLCALCGGACDEWFDISCAIPNQTQNKSWKSPIAVADVDQVGLIKLLQKR